MTTLYDWLPDMETIRADLTYVPPADFDYVGATRPWKNMTLHYYNLEVVEVFNGYEWSRKTALNWQYPLLAVAVYVCMIPLLQKSIAEPVDVGRFALCWNFGLSLFSLCGLVACAPVLVHEFLTNGFYFTTCAPAPWYGGGVHGLFVALFIYSKFAELVDTAIILLGKRSVILLHWWHHVTVLLYCWHSYCTQIATGLWFATMNYCVHSVMYAYFGCMGIASLRPRVKKFAIYITLLQLLQMVVGIFVTVRAVVFQANGKDCRVNKTNSILGLAMYSSYFLLFGKLFFDNYVLKKRTKDKRA